MTVGKDDLRKKIASLERKYDKRFRVVFIAINQLLDGPTRRFKIKGFGIRKKQGVTNCDPLTNSQPRG
jgi:hypothetical protein